MDNRIRAFREAKGLSLDQLASLTGTSNQQISNLETGKRRLTVDWLRALSKALGCHPWSLVGDELPSQLTPNDVQILGTFRELKIGQQDAVLQLLKSFAAPRKSTLLGKPAIVRWLKANQPDYLAEFQQITDLVSLNEATA